MNNLTLTGGSSQERIGPAILKKLYDLAVSGNLTTCNLSGSVLVYPAGYRTQVDYLNNNTNLLVLTYNSQYYMSFLDSNAELFFASYKGDGVGLTEQQAANIRWINLDPNNTWYGSTYTTELKALLNSITSLRELVNFTGIIESFKINELPNLRYFSIPNVPFTITLFNFSNMTSLLKKIWCMNRVLSIGDSRLLFHSNIASKSTSTLYLKSVLSLGESSISYSEAIFAIYLKDISSMAGYFMSGHNYLKHLIINNTTPPTKSDGSNWLYFYRAEKVYVPSAALLTYLDFINNYTPGDSAEEANKSEYLSKLYTIEDNILIKSLSTDSSITNIYDIPLESEALFCGIDSATGKLILIQEYM